MDLKTFQNGIFFITVQTENGKFTKKVVIN
ncbi:MAG: T9SS type A sorting domain-containing protein [Bacteroidales bacterium]|nr:T9SS type A sorting domain-containing protein [Bacteroidales bacterium]